VLAGRINAKGDIDVAGGSWPLQVVGAEADRVSLGIRAEAWDLDKEPAKRAQGCLLTGRVRHLEHHGAESLVHFVVADLGAGAEAHLVARVEPAIAAGPAIGAPISARAKPDRILVFDAAGKRIPVSAERASTLRQVANA
jgi:TOBE domain